MKTYLLLPLCWLYLHCHGVLANTAATSYEKALQYMQKQEPKAAELELRNSLQQ